MAAPGGKERSKTSGRGLWIADPPLLMGPVDTPFLAFGEVAGVDLGDLSPVKLPPWVVDALVPDSQTAERLVGQEILYKWQPRLGGWARGTVTEVNTDKTKMVGQEVCNFLVYYAVDGDTSTHHLNTHEYASNAKAKSGFWVLLGTEE